MSYRKSYGKYTYAGYQKKTAKPSTNAYRVKSPIRSFRDLEVYLQTTRLASEVYRLAAVFEHGPAACGRIIIAGGTGQGAHRNGNPEFFRGELEILKGAARDIPVWITESYSEKFTDAPAALAKLGRAADAVSQMTSRFDFLLACLDTEDRREDREKIQTLIRQYHIQKIKIINLKKAWERVFVKPAQ